ncbi:hypothetical protein ACU8V3_00170 [Cobetia marina]
MTRHALIIDDDPDFRELIAGLLSTFGFSCMESEGLQDIACDPSSLQADLILVDYELGTSPVLMFSAICVSAMSRRASF